MNGHHYIELLMILLYASYIHRRKGWVLCISFFCDVMWLLLFLSLRPVLLKLNNLFCISVSSRFVLKKFRIIDHSYQLNGRFYQRIETDFAFQTP